MIPRDAARKKNLDVLSFLCLQTCATKIVAKK